MSTFACGCGQRHNSWSKAGKQHEWARRVDGALSPVGDRLTGYTTENVVPVTTAEQDATLEWIEAIHWGTGEDVR